MAWLASAAPDPQATLGPDPSPWKRAVLTAAFCQSERRILGVFSEVLGFREMARALDGSPDTLLGKAMHATKKGECCPGQARSPDLESSGQKLTKRRKESVLVPLPPAPHSPPHQELALLGHHDKIGSGEA